MFLSISLTGHSPATDLGYLLAKHPERENCVSLAFGTARIFFPEATDERCIAVLMVDVDPVGLVRNGNQNANFALAQYVNDRPYAASSLLSTAISRTLGSALNGHCTHRPELVKKALEFEAHIPTLVATGGDAQVRRIFEPLGYSVETTTTALDPEFPAWGDSRTTGLRLRAKIRISDLLTHLFVLLPAFDRAKHYWIGQDEIDKLLAKGETWLAGHPEKDWITRRFLDYRHALANEALARLSPETEESEEPAQDPVAEAKRRSLHDTRLDTVLDVIISRGANSVVDLGCGEGKLLTRLLSKTPIPKIVGMDVSSHTLTVAARRLHMDQISRTKRARIELIQGSLLYRDERIEGFDAATLVEVIEHLDESRLGALERNVFAHARPGTVIITTPNSEYNVLFEKLTAGAFRHGDHRFEWTRREFSDWARGVAKEHGYAVNTASLGEEHPKYGAASQIAIFTRN